MGKYELLYIVHPDLESSIDKITERVRSYIEKREGKITYDENWGKRKLAYEIKKSDVGIYILIYFEAPKDALSKIERDLKLTEEVIRFMLLATEEKGVKVKKVKKEAKEEIIETKKKEEKPKVKKEEVKKEKKPAKKIKEPEAEESEEERMKKLDEKLGAILGDDKE